MWPDELRVQWAGPVFGDGFLNVHTENGFLRIGTGLKMDKFIFSDSCGCVGASNV